MNNSSNRFKKIEVNLCPITLLNIIENIYIFRMIIMERSEKIFVVFIEVFTYLYSFKNKHKIGLIQITRCVTYLK